MALILKTKLLDLSIGLLNNDYVLAGAGDDTIVTGDGNDVVFAGAGNDVVVTNDGNDKVYAGAGDDIVDAGEGNNLVEAGAGNDFVVSGEGNDTLKGDAGDDTLFAGEGDDVLDGGAGADVLQGGGSSAGDQTVVGDLYIVGAEDALLGDDGNDTFRIGDEFEGVTIIDAGVSELDNAGNEARYVEVEASEETEELFAQDTENDFAETLINTRALSEQTETDTRLNIVTRPGSAALSTFATSIAGYNAVDTLEFTKSGDFSESLIFSGIERIELASGVNIVLSAEQISENGESLDRGFINPGVQFFGVAGGPKESVTVVVEYEENTFSNANITVGTDADGNAIPYEVTYEFGDFQLDDFSVADLFSNVDAIYDANSDSEEDTYVRIDGANNAEKVFGSEGVDNATMRLGNDTYFGYGGNDLLIGHGGADYLDGGEGNDFFVIGGFGSGVQGTTSKADDGKAEWVSGDVIVGGDGVDTLRVTTGVGAVAGNNKITLNNSNFKSMEVVQVGGTVGRLNTEDGALQLINDHYYFRANSKVANLADALGNNGGSIDNVVIDASGLTTNGLTFEGNGNNQTFIGTSKADVFVGNGGNDTLTGGAGADNFVFGKVYEQIVTGAANTEQTYVNTGFSLTGVDTITDFARGTDKIELNLDQFSQLSGFNSSMLRVNATGTAADANDYLVFNSSTNTLSYDADGSGAGAAQAIAVLTGVTTLSTSDFVIA